MASRGLVPLPPADQIAVLYQLAIDADQNLVDRGAHDRDGAARHADRRRAREREYSIRACSICSRSSSAITRRRSKRWSATRASATRRSRFSPRTAVRARSIGSRRTRRACCAIPRSSRRCTRTSTRACRRSTASSSSRCATTSGCPGLAAWDEIARALQAHPTPPGDLRGGRHAVLDRGACHRTAPTHQGSSSAMPRRSSTEDTALAKLEQGREGHADQPVGRSRRRSGSR